MSSTTTSQARASTACPSFVRDLDVSKLSIGPLRSTDSGAKMAYVSYDGTPLRLQTPWLTAPFGISRYSADTKYTLSLALNAPGSEFRKFLTAFDEQMLSIAHSRSLDLFKAQKTLEQLADRYTPTVRPAKDDKYADSFKCTVAQVDGKFTATAVDADDTPLCLDDIHSTLKGARVAAIVAPTVLWVAGSSSFGVSWKLIALKCKPVGEGATTFMPDTQTLTELVAIMGF